MRHPQTSLVAAMLAWSMVHIGILCVILSYVGPSGLIQALFENPEIRSITLQMLGLGALYAVFGITVLRYKETLAQRILLLSGPPLIAVLFLGELFWFVASPTSPPGMQDLQVYGYTLRIIMAAAPSLLAAWTLRFIRLQSGTGAK